MNSMSDGVASNGHRVEMKSPGLAAADGLGAAFELKFQLTPDDAARVEAWAQKHLTPDRHGDAGKYRITSVYCDTPNLDVFHRAPGYRRSKFRLRRYDASPRVFVERKTKRGDKVRKRRTELSAEDLATLATRPHRPLMAAQVDLSEAAWEGDWFLSRVRQRNLNPICCVTYRRSAFFGWSNGMPVRMTLDRDLVGLPAADWHIPHVQEGQELLPGATLLELKFHVVVPPLFKDLLAMLPAQLARASKYRRCIQLCGLGTGIVNDDEAARAAADQRAAAKASRLAALMDTSAAPRGNA